MKPSDWIKSSVGYGRSLVGSGWDGLRSAEKTALGGTTLGTVLVGALQESWLPAAVGAYVGALGASMGQRRKPNYAVLAGAALLGGVIGLTTGMAWGTRRLTGDMARGARKNIDAVRDKHWLEKNPVPYG
jgi:hypothetical protein